MGRGDEANTDRARAMAHLPEDDLPSNFDVIVDGTGMLTLQTTEF